jgi:hypothetical protein
VSSVTGPVAGPTSAAGVQPPAPGLADVLGEPLAELGSHDGRPLQRQGLLGGQPVKTQPLEVPAVPAGDHHPDGRLGVDANLAQVSAGQRAAPRSGRPGRPVLRLPGGVAGQQLVEQGAGRLGNTRMQQGGGRPPAHWLVL